MAEEVKWYFTKRFICHVSKDKHVIPEEVTTSCQKIRVGGSEIQHLIDSDIDTNTVTADAQGNYIVIADALKLELVEENFNTVHRPRMDLGPKRISEIIE